MTGVRVEVEGGIVYLSGQVETLDDVDVVSGVVQAIDGVQDVEEELIVTSL
jgi:osmotically-inducible protein OsmY